jgi:predicted glutamine amidotransferase
MCELLAFDSPTPQKINHLLEELYRHGSEHPHGWGLAYRSAFGVSLEKEPCAATRSDYLRERLREPIVTTHAVAHIRYATKGDVAYANCHPFLGTDAQEHDWMFAHNGTVFETELTRPYLDQRQGETDSESILLYLLGSLSHATSYSDRRGDAGDRRRFQALDDAVARLARGNKLNLVFNDGTYTYVHTNYLRESLFCARFGEAIAFSTKPLSQGTWERIPLARLMAYRAGELVFTGRVHGNTYHEDEEDIRHLYQEYAML